MRLFVILGVLCGGCDGGSTGDGDDPGVPGPLRFARLVVDRAAGGPAFVEVADIDGDGRLDLVVSKFGHVEGTTLPPGEVTVYRQGATLSEWTAQPVFDGSAGIYWPNDVQAHDLDGDGDLDLTLGTGFLVCGFLPEPGPCGGVLWFEQRPEGWVRHDVVPPRSDLFYQAVRVVDLDGDGRLDLFTVGEERSLATGDRAEAVWFRGTAGEARFETTPRVVGDGLGSLPTLLDLDGDGDLDVASAEFFAGHGATAVWYEQVEAPSDAVPAGVWTRHVVDDRGGPAIQLSFIPDLLGDGRRVAVGSNHSNTAKSPADPWPAEVALYDIPADPRQPWGKRTISKHIVSVVGAPGAPQAAPGIFGWGDAEGDGDVDLLVSGDGDPRVFLLEQTAPGVFETLVLESELTQAGGMKVADLNGDGANELVVTGYDDDVVYVYVRDAEGAWPSGPATDPGRRGAPAADGGVGSPPDAAPPAGEPGAVTVHVAYAGPGSGQVVVAAFRELPAAGPPTGFTFVDAEAFPVSGTIDPVPAGPGQVMAFLDLEPFNPQFPGPEDPVGQSEPFTVDGSTVTVDVTLELP